MKFTSQHYMTKEQWITSLTQWIYSRQGRMSDDDGWIGYDQLKAEIKEWVKWWGKDDPIS